MTQEYIIQIEDLTEEGFAPYGKAILVPANPAPKTGDDWDCWFMLGGLPAGDQQVGIVKTRPSDGRVLAMEREPAEEFLLPISGPVVQAVGLPSNLQDHTEQPRANSVRAFRVQPGQAIIMAPGTWHCAAMPAEPGETLYYFITKPHPPEPGRGDSPWIDFVGGATVRLVQP